MDCKGGEFVLIRYGIFYQYVPAVRSGHPSIAIEPTADPLAFINGIERPLADLKLA
jgi:hypothetical protein